VSWKPCPEHVQAATVAECSLPRHCSANKLLLLLLLTAIRFGGHETFFDHQKNVWQAAAVYGSLSLLKS